MKKYEVLKVIKEANQIVDQMTALGVTTGKEYDNLSEALYWTLDALMIGGDRKNFTLHLSNRTNHYYVKF